MAGGVDAYLGTRNAFANAQKELEEIANSISKLGEALQRMGEATVDAELTAMKTLLDVLTPLSPEARYNVIDYLFRRLEIKRPPIVPPAEPTVPEPASPPARAATIFQPRPAADLRSLVEQKQPRSAHQMVAVLAYYLAALAPPDQHRDHIVLDDIPKYFPQADFKMPKAPMMTLVKAKNLGYLDAIGTGQYRLSLAGYNLVSYELPQVRGSGRNRGRRVGKPGARAMPSVTRGLRRSGLSILRFRRNDKRKVPYK